MPNKNYQNGRAKEYRIKKRFENAGYTVLRSAGSHGFADLVAVRNEEIVFIQCKPDSMSEEKRKEILEQHSWLNGSRKTRFTVV